MPSLKDGPPRPPPFQWMSLDEHRTQKSRATGEFPYVEVSDGVIPRRQFLQIASAAAAMLGLGGCFRPPSEKLMPYARRAPEGTPGIPLHFTTGWEVGGITVGLVAECREHHPIKIEGNPAHPGSLGATGALEQASLLGLYDPTRIQAVRSRQPAGSATLVEALQQMATRKDAGRGLRFLVEPTASPSLVDAYDRILKRFPLARVIGFAPAESESATRGAALAFGQRLSCIPRLQKARTVVSIDYDFLRVAPTTLRLGRDFVEARRPEQMNRLYSLESHLSLTGAFADHRLRSRPSEVATVAKAIASRIGKTGGRASLAPFEQGGRLSDEQTRWVDVVARDLLAHRGESVVLIGPQQSPEIHALGHLMNELLGNIGSTIELHEPLISPEQDPIALSELIREMNNGQVDSLIISAWNPVYAAYSDSGFGAALEKVKDSVYLTLHEDETAAKCSWVAAARHPFESWRDGRAFDGTASILQPLLAPVFKGTVEVWDLLSPFLGDEQKNAYGYLRAFWQGRTGASNNFQQRWEGWLAEGVIPDTALERREERETKVREEAVVQALQFAPTASDGLELRFLVDAKVHDGRYAANAWLQELPDPITQLTWDNAALLSPSTASKLGLESGQWARLSYRHRSVEAPVLVLPGHADDTVSLSIGYGKASQEGDAAAVGVNAFLLRCTDAPWTDGGLSIQPLAKHAKLALAQGHRRMEGRELALQRSVKDFEPSELEHLRREPEQFYPPREHPEETHRWAMGIDLNRCIGCSACVVACQAENNIPAVGKEQVSLGREMQWLRIDRYFMGDESDPAVITQPVACVHCEKAPCEYVCPVNATVHSDEGLNEMVYNRCIGTRYCSNNCPYKVRRFNYLDYTKSSALEQMARNPEVTVRARGVMEKCTYCVQRIERARIQARIENRAIREGEIKTACQQACPTQAIVFGDLTQSGSEASKAHRDGRRYELLHELGTQPRTVHLVRLKNPNEELK